MSALLALCHPSCPASYMETLIDVLIDGGGDESGDGRKDR